MKRLFIILVLLAQTAWGQYYPDTGEAGNMAAVAADSGYAQQNQNWQMRQRAYQQQQQIEQIQQQPQTYIEYVPVYGNGLNPTQ